MLVLNDLAKAFNKTDSSVLIKTLNRNSAKNQNSVKFTYPAVIQQIVSILSKEAKAKV